ncbi:hypothetical protein [Clostridium tyrobutyricum]|uniref:hypothetical protein n=1 Tax=Clostridium tyrobutyricum TaxID=1519 RepID=UPI0002EFE32B|nr:hypothetical protein [Clostridium tyrobutyricum]MBV4416526.1 hypothetical protein [Clostridium tyrobutyricum]
MDDGSLVIDSRKRKNGSIYIFPRIYIYTLNFSKDENILLNMHYKIRLKERFENKRLELIDEGYKNINSWSENIIENNYSKEEENFIIKSKQLGTTDKKIASLLGKSYWGIVDKIRRLKLENRI